MLGLDGSAKSWLQGLRQTQLQQVKPPIHWQSLAHGDNHARLGVWAVHPAQLVQQVHITGSTAAQLRGGKRHRRFGYGQSGAELLGPAADDLSLIHI